MKEIFKLALRNLREHKAKTIIISLFLIIGVAIVVVGNSFLESVNRGLEKDFRANYTGDIAVGTKPNKGDFNDIFGVNTVNFSGQIPQLPAINEMDKVESIIKNTKGIEQITKLISAQVLVATADADEMDFSSIMGEDLTLDDLPISILFAGEDVTYREMFPGIKFIEGTYPAPNTNEVILDERVKKAYESMYKKQLAVGDKILIAGANTKGIVREAVVSGIIKPSNEYSAMFQCIYCNPSLARSFADLTYGTSVPQDLPDSVDLEISSLDEEDLFSDIVEVDTSILSTSNNNFDDILGDTSLRDQLNTTDDGAWHYFLIKLDNPSKDSKIIEQLNSEFEKEGLNVHALNWKDAAYSYSQVVSGIGLIFNILIIILAVVVFIIIMNTMTINVIERTGEVGTMRAIGAEKKFIRLLFFVESTMLTLSASIIGIILAIIISEILNAQEWVITNSIVKMILGGGLIRFTPTLKIVICTIVISFLGGLLSNLSPISYALKITPLKALTKE